MITIRSTIAAVAAALRALVGGIPHTIDDSIEAVLEEALVALEAKTPVRTGHMRASWFLEHDGPGLWSFGDAADYASYVRKQQKSQAIEAELGDVETTLTEALSARLTTYLGLSE